MTPILFLNYRQAERRVLQKMEVNQDTQAYYYTPLTSRYEKMVRDNSEKTIENTGVN